MTPEQIERFASDVWEARLECRTLHSDEVTRRCAGPHTLDDAYRIQASILQRRIDRGERRVGWKLGYTSEAMRAQMGISQPNFGPLTDAMLLSDGSAVPESVIQPRVEPEIAIRLGRDLRAPASIDTVISSIDETVACLEVVDSVWSDYRFRIEHNTADGSSAAHVVLGSPIMNEDLAATAVQFVHNGHVVTTANGSAASGHPLAGVVWLSARLAERGRQLRAGELIITGGLTAAIPLDPGDSMEAIFDGEMTVSVQRAASRP